MPAVFTVEASVDCAQQDNSCSPSGGPGVEICVALTGDPGGEIFDVSGNPILKPDTTPATAPATITVTNTNTGTTDSTVLDVGEEYCFAYDLDCGTTWVFEIDVEGTLTNTVDAFCPCPPPFEIKGFTPSTGGGTLGDGSDLRVLIMPKGGGSILGELFPTSGSFNRILDQTSELSLSGTISGQDGAPCCDGWEDLHPWGTEIIVYRDGRDVWAGPVTNVVFGRGTVEVQASDMTAWWDRRTVPDLSFTNTDLADIFESVHEGAMAPDPSPNMNVIVTKTNIAGTRRFYSDSFQYASDVIDELCKTGLDYVAYGRTILVSSEEVDIYPYVTLLDEHWIEPPNVVERGNEQATVVVVKGRGVQATAIASREYIDYYGYLVRVFDEPSIEDQYSANFAAMTRLDMLKDPTYIETPQGAGLKPGAPITLEQLIPGIKIRVDTRSTCRPLVADFRLDQVKVNFNGTVAIDLEPIGHTVGQDDISSTATTSTLE